MALSISIRADATQFSRTIAGVRVEMSGLSGGIANAASEALGLAASLAKVGIGVAAVGGAMAVAFIRSASQSASKIESLTMQFETLLGSTEAAQKRMEEIKEFAASTPFEVANLSETSKLLQTLGGDLLATGAGLRLVGDAASIAGQPIQEVGLHIGRLFNAITSGTSAGESIARLQELGLISGKVKLDFESLAAAQKKGAVATLTSNEALKKLQEVLSKTDGAMERLSRTTEGKLSNMGDAISNLKVSFGTGFNDGLKVALDATNNFLPQLEGKFTRMGKLLGTAIKQAVEGDYKLFVEIGILIAEAIGRGFADVVGNFMVEGMRELAIKQGLKQGHSPERIKEVTDNFYGPKRTVSERAMDIMDDLKPQRAKVSIAEVGSEWGRKLEAQRLRVDNELLEEAKKTNQLLRNSQSQQLLIGR